MISSWFGAYAIGSLNEIVEMKQQPIYTEDWIGLQTLDKANKLTFKTVPVILQKSVNTRVYFCYFLLLLLWFIFLSPMVLFFVVVSLCIGSRAYAFFNGLFA